MGGDDKTNINHPVYHVKQGDPDFLEVWKQIPETSEAAKLVKKLSLADQRKLMVEEGALRASHAAPPCTSDPRCVRSRARPRQTRPGSTKCQPIGAQRASLWCSDMFKQEPSDEPYDQFKVVERDAKMITAVTLPPNQVRKLALAAMEKRLAREEQVSLVTVAKDSVR